MKTRGVCELTLESADHRALADFYRRVLDLPVLSERDDRIWLACGERTRLGLWSVGAKEFGDRGGRHVHFAFSVHRDELHSIAQRLQHLDVSHQGPIEHDGGDYSVYFDDPDGNVVEVWDFFEDGNGRLAGVAAL